MARSRTSWLARAALVLGLYATAAAGEPLEELERAQQRLFEQVAPAVVFISSGDSFGSGFFVRQDGLILTNAHVVGSRDTVDVIRSDGQKLRGKVVERAAEDLDLALVQVEVKGVPVLPLTGFSDLRVGSWVASVGHGSGGIWTFTTGMVSNIYPVGAERPVFQTQIPLNPGNSGGPVFDRWGRVAGVVTASLKESQAINFAIRADLAIRKLKGLAELCDCLVVTVPVGLPVFVDGKMVGTGPRVVVPVDKRTHEVFVVVKGQMRRKQVSFPEQREVDLQ
jgi:S1-C subfamily serine protease